MVTIVASCSSPTAVQLGVDESRTIDVDGQLRSYVVYVPEGTPPRTLILVFHGSRGYGEAARLASGFDDVARQMNAAIAYLDAGRANWAEDCRCIPADSFSVADTMFVSQIAQMLSAEFHIDPGALAAVGFSQGGLFAQRLACQMADRFRSVAVVAATISPSLAQRCRPAAPVQLIMMLSTTDPAIPWEGTGFADQGFLGAEQTFGEWVEANGCLDSVKQQMSGTLRYYARLCPPGSGVELIGVDNGSHSWAIEPAFDTRAEILRSFRNASQARALE